jgi:hypothetical protein
VADVLGTIKLMLDSNEWVTHAASGPNRTWSVNNALRKKLALRAMVKLTIVNKQQLTVKVGSAHQCANCASLKTTTYEKSWRRHRCSSRTSLKNNHLREKLTRASRRLVSIG